MALLKVDSEKVCQTKGERREVCEREREKREKRRKKGGTVKSESVEG